MRYLIDVVFVIFMPNYETLIEALNSIESQVRTVYVIDNSDCIKADNELMYILNTMQNVVLVRLFVNVGIGKAQNIGMKKCIEKRSDFILLSDQDTIYPPNYIEQMFAKFDSIYDNQKIAAIAPNFTDSNKCGDSEGFFYLNGLNSIKIKSILMYEDVSQVIASGMIINTSYISDIGMMDEDLFIDWVDFEWCWRAKSKGYRIIGFSDIHINHTLGDSSAKIANKTYSIHLPERNYYIVRNGISISLTKRYLSLQTRWNIFLKSLRYMIGFSLLCRQHFKNIKFCLQGFYHGLIGRLGPY